MQDFKLMCTTCTLPLVPERISRECPAPREAAGAHTTPAAPGQPNHTNPAKPRAVGSASFGDSTTAVRKTQGELCGEKWGNTPGSLEEEGERSWVVN